MRIAVTLGLGISLIALIILSVQDHKRVSSIKIEDAQGSSNILGTPPREEREFKIGVSGANKVRTKEINHAVYQALVKALRDSTRWNVPSMFSSQYYLTLSEELFIFRDLYFDSDDQILSANNSSIRLRYRWDSEFSYKKFMNGEHRPEARPTRVEIQAKVGKRGSTEGYSEVAESRLQFSKGQPPVKTYFELGRARLLLPLLIQSVKQGRYEGTFHTPGRALAELVDLISPGVKRLSLSPRLAIVSKRYRMHVNMVNPWGSGPNPDHTFIITLDRFAGKRTPADLRWERQLNAVSRDLFSGEFTERLEVEVEFERNTSSRLDDEIQSLALAGKQKQKDELEHVRSLFLRDQEMLVKIVTESLSQIGLKTFPVTESKYLSTFQSKQE